MLAREKSTIDYMNNDESNQQSKALTTFSRLPFFFASHTHAP